MKDHERSDWNLSYVVWGSITLTVSVAVILAGSWWLFRQFHATAGNRQVDASHFVKEPEIPPEPRLQISPDEDWEEMLKREQAILNTYRWIDRSQGIVHIPIERAMELIAQGKSK